MTQRSTKIGYARVSTTDQSLDLQHQALTQAGCYQTYSDHGVTGRTMARPQLEACLKVKCPRFC
ncbi:recombinase family protein, partial [Rothia nasimurium]|uniref:recombinase family protein n=3 Tax=Rothia TaxID=32207 RepID=UPI0015D83367